MSPGLGSEVKVKDHGRVAREQGNPFPVTSFPGNSHNNIGGIQTEVEGWEGRGGTEGDGRMSETLLLFLRLLPNVPVLPR